MPALKRTAILLISCPDRPGLVSSVSTFIGNHKGNIVYLDQHVDEENGAFFMRIEWEMDGFELSEEQLNSKFNLEIASESEMTWQLHYNDQPPRAAIFVTKEGHCLYDLLSRHESGELNIQIPLIISNHDSLKQVADRFGIPFHQFSINKENKADQESAEISVLKEHNVDTVILARYMQILSDNFVNHFPNQIINIHHSFLPAFAGARPYHQAYQRGVKLIGATSHYVTADLDEGPIIAQDVIRVTHRESLSDFIRHGRDLEKIVLSRGVWAHSQRKVLVLKNKTVVFS
ncbi:MAG: formyltetrahydrofolate deformylase [Verrucomicrobiales bacterium]|nr:formyltetrahydrofolate deformylase [Verrucomicrobiales bacterium]HAA87733.1 formyltetrahydrofolate deformylase [Verrucomicrobiales bacterium]|tara:strand:- start:969 stop:1835 length:867 start_codon:yes stop_codon:yes gene_type:complete